MSACLALVVATVVSAATPNPSATGGPRAVQYVQVQYRNVLTSSGFPVASNMAASYAKAQLSTFVSSVLRNALTHANPLLGLLVNQIASRVTAKLTNVAPPDMHAKPNVKVVAEYEATTTISADRTRTDLGNITTIVQCDKQRILVLENTTKTYSIRSFDESVRDDNAAPGFGPFGGTQADASLASVEIQPDDGAVTIAGVTAHHSVTTVPLTSGFAIAKSDLWFTDVPIPNRCSSATAQSIGSSPLPPAKLATSVRVPLRSVEWSQMNFGADSPTPTPAPASSTGAAATPMPYEDPVLGTPGIAWLETTSVKVLPYDSSYFDVPEGYSLAPTEPNPSHS